jgi:hypothetical protein
MTVRLDKLERAFEDVLASVGVSEDQELITKEQCSLFVSIAQGSPADQDLIRETFEKDFNELAEGESVSRRRLIEMMILRMKDKGMIII